MICAWSVALETLAVLHMDSGRLDEAEDLLQRTVAVKGVTASVLNHYGELSLRRADYGAAQRYFLDAIKQHDWKPAYYWNLAIAYERDGNCADGSRTWQKYLEVEHSAVERQKVIEHLRQHYDADGGTCF